MTKPTNAARTAKAPVGKDAKRAAVKDEARPGHVAVRVLPMGDGRIADGSFGPAPERFGHYRRGDEPRLPRAIAEALEAKGWVEISGGS